MTNHWRLLIDTTRNDHFIEVIKYDSIARTVEGRFQVFFEKEPSNPNGPACRTVFS
ncbi:MAG: hypothetical protein IPJ82_08625 [Lewinellaceae bacterium]|nr:hypothetical protein [Lewinellaceae bacterium]